jgi:riboflavin synthase
MFTGLVEETGVVEKLERLPSGGVRLLLSAPLIQRVLLGDSIAVNGCCLTVAAIEDGLLRFDLLQETLDRTSLGGLERGGCVNIERALAAGGRLGRTFCAGPCGRDGRHFGAGTRGPMFVLRSHCPLEGARYLVPKGSIAVDGISLTVAELHQDRFVLWIIPHTLAATNLGRRQVGERVNLEYDLLAKYVERMLAPLLRAAVRGRLPAPLSSSAAPSISSAVRPAASQLQPGSRCRTLQCQGLELNPPSSLRSTSKTCSEHGAGECLLHHEISLGLLLEGEVVFVIVL